MVFGVVKRPRAFEPLTPKFPQQLTNIRTACLKQTDQYQEVMFLDLYMQQSISTLDMNEGCV